MLVETAWKSCSGARAIIRTLKMNPAAATPSMLLHHERSGVEEDLFGEHDQEERADESGSARQENSLIDFAFLFSGVGCLPSASRPALSASRRVRRRIANGTTIRLSSGAATMPIATIV